MGVASYGQPWPKWRHGWAAPGHAQSGQVTLGHGQVALGHGRPFTKWRQAMAECFPYRARPGPTIHEVAPWPGPDNLAPWPGATWPRPGANPPGHGHAQSLAMPIFIFCCCMFIGFVVFICILQLVNGFNLSIIRVSLLIILFSDDVFEYFMGVASYGQPWPK